jgi:hypothetical protein
MNLQDSVNSGTVRSGANSSLSGLADLGRSRSMALVASSLRMLIPRDAGSELPPHVLNMVSEVVS